MTLGGDTGGVVMAAIDPRPLRPVESGDRTRQAEGTEAESLGSPSKQRVTQQPERLAVQFPLYPSCDTSPTWERMFVGRRGHIRV